VLKGERDDTHLPQYSGGDGAAERTDCPQGSDAGAVKVIPGMPAQVFIKTGVGTVALYALKPLLDSFNRAFRED